MSYSAMTDAVETPAYDVEARALLTDPTRTSERRSRFRPDRAFVLTSALLGLFALLLYLMTFASQGHTLGSRADVIADADTGPFTTMLSEWSMSRQFGDAWNLENRNDLDRTQEHKIKHVLLGALFGPPSKLAISFGADRFSAAKLASAFCASVNVLLIWLLFAWTRIRRSVALPMSLLLMFAPGQWVFAALPESWPLTGTFVLIALLLQIRKPDAPLMVGAVIGLGMLNNIALAVLCIVPVADAVIQRKAVSTGVRRGFCAGIAALTMWAGGLSLFSLSDPDLRPDRVLSFLAFFSDLVGGEGGSVLHKRLIRSATQISLSAFASVQSDPITGSVITSARESTLSIVGMIAMLLLYFMALWTAARTARTAPRSEWRPLLLSAITFFSLWGLLFWRFPVFTWFYSPALLPPLVFVLGLSLRHSNHVGLVVAWASVAIVAACGFSQVSVFRALVANFS